MEDDKIISEFAELFGFNDETEEEESVEESQTDEEAQEEELTEEPSEEEESEEPSEEEPKNKKQSQQNYAFAELRKTNKVQANLIKDLGKAIGMDTNASVEDITAKVKELILEKQSKDSNIPIDTLRELEGLRQIVQENNELKIQNKVQAALSDLASKYSIDDDNLLAFAKELDENGRNPFVNENIDIESEYLKTHWQDIIKKEVDKALATENKRKEDVVNHSGSGVVTSNNNDGIEAKEINSVKDLDKLFNSIDL